MKRTIKSTLAALSMFALVALSVMPAAASSLEGHSAAGHTITTSASHGAAHRLAPVGTPATPGKGVSGKSRP